MLLLEIIIFILNILLALYLLTKVKTVKELNLLIQETQKRIEAMVGENALILQLIKQKFEVKPAECGESGAIPECEPIGAKTVEGEFIIVDKAIESELSKVSSTENSELLNSQLTTKKKHQL